MQIFHPKINISLKNLHSQFVTMFRQQVSFSYEQRQIAVRSVHVNDVRMTQQPAPPPTTQPPTDAPTTQPGMPAPLGEKVLKMPNYRLEHETQHTAKVSS
jgi:hypothetical protein